MYTDSLPSSTSQWIRLLSISTTFNFTRIRQRAIHELNTRYQIDPVEEIVLAEEFNIPEWRKPAYEALVQRENGPTHEEAQKLGILTSVSLYMAREAIRKVDGGLSVPFGGGTPLRVSQVVDDVFWPPLTASTSRSPSPPSSPGLFRPCSPQENPNCRYIEPSTYPVPEGADPQPSLGCSTVTFQPPDTPPMVEALPPSEQEPRDIPPSDSYPVLDSPIGGYPIEAQLPGPEQEINDNLLAADPVPESPIATAPWGQPAPFKLSSTPPTMEASL